MKKKILSEVEKFTSSHVDHPEKYDHVLFYRSHGSWNTNCTVPARAKFNRNRIIWNGEKLLFTPPGNSFDLNDMAFFSFMLQAPKGMVLKNFMLKFTYTDGKPFIREFKTPHHTGWKLFYTLCGVPPRQTIIGHTGPTARNGKVTKIEFITDEPDFTVVLDDIHFIRRGLRFDFPDHLFPPVTNGCFFPEFVKDEIIAAILADPEFDQKMAEIEELRKQRLPIKLAPQETDPEKLTGTKLFDKICENGLIRDLTPEDAKRIHEEKKYSHDYHETLMHYVCLHFDKMLAAWQNGTVARSAENRKKFFSSLIYYLSGDMNRRGENFRYIGAIFIIPGTVADVYRTFFPEMEAVENGSCQDPLSIRLNRVLKEAVSWCCTFPLDRPEGEFLTVESFRHSSAWTGGNFGFRPLFHAALICRNPRILDVIAKVAEGALTPNSFNTKKTAFWLDGITVDGSAWGHGTQNYPFGYPFFGVSVIGSLLKEFKGTSWEINVEGSRLISTCTYLESLIWHGTGWELIQKSYPRRIWEPRERTSDEQIPMLQRDLLTACGRSGQQYHGNQGYETFETIPPVLKCYSELFPPDHPIAKRLLHCCNVISGKCKELPTGTRYFWNNDLMLCREKDAVAAITMLSSKTTSCENAPSNSHYCDFWCDGSAWINKPFDAYRHVRGFFDPSAIPGVTARKWNFEHKGNTWRTYTGKYRFAGGAPCGNYAVCGYKMERKLVKDSILNFYGLKACKAYFWFDGKLICLTAGITDKTKQDLKVTTTLDQTSWRSKIFFGKNRSAQPGETVKAKSDLLWHDGIGYIVLNGKGVLTAEERTKDNWIKFDPVNKGRNDLPASAPILMFQIDHGRNPENAACAYIVDFHCRDFKSLKNYAENPTLEILAQKTTVQAVREKSSGTLAAVFYHGGIEVGGLKTDSPAVVLLRESADGKVQVTLNDPCQNPKRNAIIVSWKNKSYKINMPTGSYSGQPVTEYLTDANLIKCSDAE